jgi:hypothetical protein
MTAVIIPGALDIVRTNADWELDLIFCQGVETLVEDWTGSDVSVVVWRKAGAQSWRLELASADAEGLLPPTAYVPVAIRVPAASMNTLPAGNYNGEVRRLFPGGAVEFAATFALKLEQGQTVPEGEPGGISGDDTAGLTVKVLKQVGSVRLVRSGGARGLSAKQVVLDSEPEDLVPNATDAEFATWIRKPATDAATEVSEAVTGGLAQIGEAGAEQVGLVNAAGAAQDELLELEGDFQIGEIEDAGDAVTGVGGTIDIRENMALDAIDTREDEAIGAVDATTAGVVAAVEAAGDDRLALIAAAHGGDLFPDTTAGLSNGAVAILAVTAGSGGTNGTFDAAITGGGGTGMAIRFVVAGGGVTQATILNPGINYTGAPAISLAASAGLGGGAAITVTLGARNSVGEYFSTPGTNGAAFNVYRVDAGPVATFIKPIWGTDPADPQTLKLVQARYDRQINAGLRDYPDLLPVKMYMGTLSGGAVLLADGTYEYPPGAKWVSPQLSAGVFDVAGLRYAQLPMTEPLTGVLQIRVYWGGVTIAAGNTTTNPQAGVAKQSWSNTVPRPYVQIEIENVSATVTARSFDLEVTATDHALLPQIIHASLAPPVIDPRPLWEEKFEPHLRWRNQRLPLRAAAETSINKAVNSVTGSDGNAGGRFTPKANITGLTGLGALADGDVVGLWGEWDNQGFGSSVGTLSRGLIFTAQPQGRRRAGWDGEQFRRQPSTRMNGDTDVTDQVWTLESGNTWKTPIVMNTGTNLAPVNDGYSTLHVLRVERALMADTPLAAERLMRQATSKANCIATADSSFFELVSGPNYTLYVTTPDGLAPDVGAYRYRPCTTFAAIAWGQNVDRDGGAVFDIFFSHFNYGLGIVNGGQNIDYVGCAFAHNPKHITNSGGGSYTGCFWYSRGYASSNLLNVYHPDALGLSVIIRDVVIDSDTPGGSIYMHRGGISFTGDITDDVMTVTSALGASEALRDGYVVRNAAETVAVGTYIAEQLTSTEAGGTLGKRGTYRLTIGGQAIASGTLGAGGNYHSFEVSGVSDVFVPAASGALSADHPQAFDQVENGLIEGYYSGGYYTAFGEAGSWAVPCNSICRNSLALDCSRNNSFKDKHDNVVLVRNASIDSGNSGMRMQRLMEGHQVHHETVIARTVQTAYGDANPGSDYLPVIYEIGSTAAQQQGQVPGCTRTLLIIDCPLSTVGVRIRVDSSAGLAGFTDWNLIVNFTPGNMSSTVFGGATKLTWAEYLTSFAPNDANSELIDWRGMKGGSENVLVDPDNFDFRIRTDTWQGRYLLSRIRAMDVGAAYIIGRKPRRLTADEYLATLQHG